VIARAVSRRYPACARTSVRGADATDGTNSTATTASPPGCSAKLVERQRRPRFQCTPSEPRPRSNAGPVSPFTAGKAPQVHSERLRAEEQALTVVADALYSHYRTLPTRWACVPLEPLADHLILLLVLGKLVASGDTRYQGFCKLCRHCRRGRRRLFCRSDGVRHSLAQVCRHFWARVHEELRYTR
jgi:hypothetical protein